MKNRLLLTIVMALFADVNFAQTTLDTAVNFYGKDPYGNPVDLFEYLDEGNLVLIDFFNSM